MLHGSHPILAVRCNPQYGTPENPLRVAIVGSGPAGFYAAEHLLKRAGRRRVEVDMFDRLPTPFGLVRAGVAPDHPKIKSVIRVYEKTAAREGFQFFGNVEIGARRHRRRARASATTRSSRPTARRPTAGSGSRARTCPARTGHRVRQLVQRPPRLRRPRLRPDGQARGRDRQRQRGRRRRPHARPAPRRARPSPTPPTTRSRSSPSSGIEEIVVLGRRGPAQAAFTNPEVRELGELTDADIVIDPAEMELDAASRAYFESEDCEPTHRRNVEIFTEFSQRSPEGKPKRVVMRFCCSPVEIRGDGQGREHRDRPQRARRGRVGPHPRPRHRRARGDRVRARAALDRLQGRRAGGHPLQDPGAA